MSADKLPDIEQIDKVLRKAEQADIETYQNNLILAEESFAKVNALIQKIN